MEGPEQKTRRPQPCVVMLVANPFLHDTRVYKEARSLIEWGCEVHVLALYDRDLPVSEEVDGIHVRRISMRHGDVARLGTIVLWWWCRPVLRWLVGSRHCLKFRRLIGTIESDNSFSYVSIQPSMVIRESFGGACCMRLGRRRATF